MRTRRFAKRSFERLAFVQILLNHSYIRENKKAHQPFTSVGYPFSLDIHHHLCSFSFSESLRKSRHATAVASKSASNPERPGVPLHHYHAQCIIASLYYLVKSFLKNPLLVLKFEFTGNRSPFLRIAKAVRLASLFTTNICCHPYFVCARIS